jgi:hypothetical protein
MTLTHEEALESLARTVERFHREGRIATAAGVKARMRSATHRDFDEVALGFATFRAFLKDAEGRRVVTLHKGAQDILVTPPGLTVPPEPIARLPERLPSAQGHFGVDANDARRIRADLWKAFIDWSPGLQRLFDREEGRAFTLPTLPSPNEPSSQRARREVVARSPERFLGIEHIPFDDQLGWMHDFAGRQPPPIREQLQVALGSHKPVRDFTAQVRQVPALASAWNALRVQRVGEVIEKWARASAVELEIWQSPAPQPGASTYPPSHRARSADDDDRLRSALHRAIDIMPPEELAAIRLPAGYVLGIPGR